MTGPRRSVPTGSGRIGAAEWTEAHFRRQWIDMARSLDCLRHHVALTARDRSTDRRIRQVGLMGANTERGRLALLVEGYRGPGVGVAAMTGMAGDPARHHGLVGIARADAEREGDHRCGATLKSGPGDSIQGARLCGGRPPVANTAHDHLLA